MITLNVNGLHVPIKNPGNDRVKKQNKIKQNEP